MDKNSLILTLLSLKGWGSKKVYSYVDKYSFDYNMCREALTVELSDDEKEEFKIQLNASKQKIKNNIINGISCISILDDFFPRKLYTGTEKVVFLFYKGNIELLLKPSITIVGTRKPTEDFINVGKKVSQLYSQKGYVLVSGLALGCDAIVHQSCVDINGLTIAVLPSPCDNPQPTSNKYLAQQILNKNGLLISEYGTGEEVSKYNFPRRDIIQSLLSNVLLVIQASNESGTMIAVKQSLRDKKQVFALKGNTIDLIKNYISLEDASDLEQYIE